MKAIILAGGFGYRLGSETIKKPKPLIEINNKPLIWYIMKNYSYNGLRDFIICTGYKHNSFINFFNNFEKIEKNSFIKKNSINEFDISFKDGIKWSVNLIYTGLNTNTGGRIKKISKYINSKEIFCVS